MEMAQLVKIKAQISNISSKGRMLTIVCVCYLT